MATSRIVPPAIAIADYPLARNPQLGCEVKVFVSTGAHGITKKRQYLGSNSYAPVIDYGAISGSVACSAAGPTGLGGEYSTIIVKQLWQADYAATDPTFPVGFAGKTVIATDDATAAWGVRSGDQVYEVGLPEYDTEIAVGAAGCLWYPVNAVRSLDSTYPTRESKSIADGLESSRWVVPGKTQIGELSMSAMNLGEGDGLLRIGGQNTCVMVQIWKAGRVWVANRFFLNWNPSITINDPEGDGESTVSARGQFSQVLTFLAPGTAP